MSTKGQNLRGFNVTGTHSHNYQCQSMGRISETSMSHGHIHITINANQWAESQRLQCQQEHKDVTINAKPKGTISKALMSTETQAINY